MGVPTKLRKQVISDIITMLEAVPFYADLDTADRRGRYIENGVAFDFENNRVVIRAREV